ncbi:MAG: hypothetical protein CEE41_05110 [Hadesarchaea archaeon B3_Hades]|nr:MAG: hypothetical protein CEE41_05110 [Hadesarchaea archaeon B3_Hades]
MRNKRIKAILENAEIELRGLLESWSDDDICLIHAAIGSGKSVMMVIDRIVHKEAVREFKKMHKQFIEKRG